MKANSRPDVKEAGAQPACRTPWYAKETSLAIAAIKAGFLLGKKPQLLGKITQIKCRHPGLVGK